ncbi:site-specific DNA-methyltransferase [Edwardsiella tarda]|uniref:DNA methyltransferase n=1 Tax=Edwardsiella tarda TaxID=636 RepID=UPI00266ECA2D|nr:DNA methyltransferase [Edwardsiella tarda]WKS80056.1 site-specific DNA-methyltransferase [Edwardsiella tarda]
MEEAISDGRIWFGRDGNGVPRIKTYLNAKERGLTPETLLFAADVGTNESAKNILKALFGGHAAFDTPKPVGLISTLMQMSLNDGDLVLDFFAGSGTTAQSVFELNKSNYNRIKFILVQLPEVTGVNSEARKLGYKTISSVTVDRIKNASNIFHSDVKDGFDAGFKLLKLDESNIRTWDSTFDNLESSLLTATDSIKPDRTTEDVLYEILLKYGIELTVPVEQATVHGQQVFVVGAGALLVCLADEITSEVVEGIAKLKQELDPETTQVVFKDAGFADSVVKTNAIQILKQAGIDDVKSI